MKFVYKVKTFLDSKDLENWLDNTDFWAVEGVWGTPSGIHLLYSNQIEEEK